MLVNTKGNIVAGDSSSELDDEAMKYTINKNNT